MATSYGNGHPQYESRVTHMITDIIQSEVEIAVTRKLTNIISGALKSPVGEFPLTEYYYYIREDENHLEIYDRNEAYLIEVGLGSFTEEEIEWIRENLPLFGDGEGYQDPKMVKLEFKKWKNEWWNVFRLNGTQINLIGYVRPLMEHLIGSIDIDSDKPVPKHYFEDRNDNTIVTQAEMKIINDFIERQASDVHIIDISVIPEVVEVYVGDSVYLDIHAKPSWCINPIIHASSSNEQVAYIENDTTVTGQSEGRCSITLDSDDVDEDGIPLVSITLPVTVLQMYSFVNTEYEVKMDSDTHITYNNIFDFDGSTITFDLPVGMDATKPTVIRVDGKELEPGLSADYVMKNGQVTFTHIYDAGTSNKILVYTGNRYIRNIMPGTNVEKFLRSFKNNRSFLHVYTDEGFEVTNISGEPIKTGMRVELIIDGNIYDRADVIVLGDVNGDSLTDSTDLVLVQRHTLGIQELQYPFTIAGDINDDGEINAIDTTAIRKYINTGSFE